MNPEIPQQIQIWSLSAAFLFLKMWSNSLIQGVAVFKQKHVYLREDAKFLKNASTDSPEPELATRASYCWENDLENIPIFLFLLLAYALINGEPVWCARFAVVFCASRVVHAFCMLKAIQPWRNIAYQIGIATCLALVVSVVNKLV